MQTIRHLGAALGLTALLGVAACAAKTAGHGTAAGVDLSPAPTSTATSGAPDINLPTAPSGPTSTATWTSPTPSPTLSPTPSPTHSPKPSPHAGTPPSWAVKELTSRGFDPADQAPAWYDDHTLNAIIGVKHDSADGYSQFVFFFVHHKYIGKDTSDPSAVIHYVSGSDLQVTVKYAIYKASDPMADPTGGSKTVRYLWNGNQLVPLDAIPSAGDAGRR